MIFQEGQEWWRDSSEKDKVLARHRRIRREISMPDGLAEENDKAVQYPHRLPCAVPGHIALYRRTGWTHVGESASWRPKAQGEDEEEDEMVDRVQSRSTFVWIVAGGVRVAGLHFVEFYFAFSSDNFLYEAMDSDSSERAFLASILTSSWPDFAFELGIYGNVVELATVWADPRYAMPGVWIEPARALIHRLMRKACLLVAHAFPLEYESRVPKGAASAVGFERRRAAMMRGARTAFDLQPFPAGPGQDGWVWCSSPRLGEVAAPKPLQQWLRF